MATACKLSALNTSLSGPFLDFRTKLIERDGWRNEKPKS